MRQRSATLLLSGLLFLAVYLCGYFLAADKPLWLDEHYSLTRSIIPVPYSQIFQGRLEWEGNNSPFFYASQKLLCGLISYDPAVLVPFTVPGGMVFYDDPVSNADLRLIAIFFMALAPAVLFYYFSRRYSWAWGSFAALLCMSSWLFWWYGLEARPYIHVLALTAIQGVIFLEIFRLKVPDGRLWAWFGAVNILLAFTVTTSVLQVLVMGAVCAALFRRALSLRNAFFVFILPAAITLYYYAIGLKLKGKFWFMIPLYKYYLANVPWDVLLIMGAFFVYAGLSWVMAEKGRCWLGREEIRRAAPAAFLMIALSLAYFILLAFLKTADALPSEGGSPFAHRYLISLVPLGALAVTVFSRTVFERLQGLGARAGFILFLAGILAWRCVHCYLYVHKWIGL